MFYYLNGNLEYRDATTCVIDCGGVGYKLTVSLVTSDLLVNKMNQKVKLFTHLAVREDGIELFGFGTNEASYQVNFNDWSRCLKGNVFFICLISLLFISAVFVGIGIYRIYKNKKR